MDDGPRCLPGVCLRRRRLRASRCAPAALLSCQNNTHTTKNATTATPKQQTNKKQQPADPLRPADAAGHHALRRAARARARALQDARARAARRRRARPPPRHLVQDRRLRDVPPQARRLRGALWLHQIGAARLPHRLLQEHAAGAAVHLQDVLEPAAAGRGAAQVEPVRVLLLLRFCVFARRLLRVCVCVCVCFGEEGGRCGMGARRGALVALRPAAARQRANFFNTTATKTR